MTGSPRGVAILLFDEVEVLDFCGPFEVFSVTGRRDGLEPFAPFTVAEDRPVRARGGLSINPRYTLDTCPPASILLVPGGYGTRRELQNDRLLRWISQRATDAELVLSVCTGALLLGKVGLLDGLTVTTHHSAFDVLADVAPAAHIDRERRVIDNGRVIVSAGVSAGIDMSLHVVSRLLDSGLAEEAARYMEYDWQAAPAR